MILKLAGLHNVLAPGAVVEPRFTHGIQLAFRLQHQNVQMDSAPVAGVVAAAEMVIAPHHHVSGVIAAAWRVTHLADLGQIAGQPVSIGQHGYAARSRLAQPAFHPVGCKREVSSRPRSAPPQQPEQARPHSAKALPPR